MGTAYLSGSERLSFAQDGYVVVPQVLPRSLAEVLGTRVLETLAAEAQGWAEADLQPDQHGDDLNEALDVLKPLIEELLGESTRLEGAQFTVRRRVLPAPEHQPHVDGAGQLYKHKKTVADLPHFRVAAGLILSDLSKLQRGNLLVMPGGHLRVRDYFRAFPSEKFEEACTGDAANH